MGPPFVRWYFNTRIHPCGVVMLTIRLPAFGSSRGLTGTRGLRLPCSWPRNYVAPQSRSPRDLDHSLSGAIFLDLRSNDCELLNRTLAAALAAGTSAMSQLTYCARTDPRVSHALSGQIQKAVRGDARVLTTRVPTHSRCGRHLFTFPPFARVQHNGFHAIACSRRSGPARGEPPVLRSSVDRRASRRAAALQYVAARVLPRLALPAAARSRAGLATTASARRDPFRGFEPAGSGEAARTRSKRHRRARIRAAISGSRIRARLRFRHRRTCRRRRCNPLRAVPCLRFQSDVVDLRAAASGALDGV